MEEIEYDSGEPEGVSGAIADFVCFHCPLVRLRAQPPAATKIHPQRNEKPPRHTPQGDTFHLLEAAAFSGYNRFCSLRMQVK